MSGSRSVLESLPQPRSKVRWKQGAGGSSAAYTRDEQEWEDEEEWEASDGDLDADLDADFDAGPDDTGADFETR